MENQGYLYSKDNIDNIEVKEAIISRSLSLKKSNNSEKAKEREGRGGSIFLGSKYITTFTTLIIL